MRHLYLIIITLAAALATSCGGTGSGVENALSAYSAGDTGRAQRDADAVMADTAAFNALSVSELCRLAELYASLPGDQETNDASAVRCLGRARKIDNDSVDAFLAELRTEPGRHLRTLDNVGAYLSMPLDSLFTEDAPADSAAIY